MQKSGVTVAKVVVEPSKGNFTVHLENLSDNPVTVYTDIVTGVLEPVFCKQCGGEKVVYFSTKCRKIFRRNDNPHKGRVENDEFYTFSQTTGSKGSRTEELRKFMTRAEETPKINLREQRNLSERRKKSNTTNATVCRKRRKEMRPGDSSGSDISSSCSSKDREGDLVEPENI